MILEGASTQQMVKHRLVLSRLINSACVVDDDWEPVREENPGEEVVKAGRELWPEVERILHVRAPSGGLKQLDYFSGNHSWRAGDHEAFPERPLVNGIDLDDFSMTYLLGANFVSKLSEPVPLLDPSSPHHLIILFDIENTFTTSARSLLPGASSVERNFRALLVILTLENSLEDLEEPIVHGAQVIFYPAIGDPAEAPLLMANQTLLEPRE